MDPPHAKHRPALSLKRLPEFLQRLNVYHGRKITALAIKQTLVIFIRSSELRFAFWSEIDLRLALWALPAEREPIPGVKHSHRGAKMRTPHLIPLSRQAIEMLKQVKEITEDGSSLIFPGDHDPTKPIR